MNAATDLRETMRLFRKEEHLYEFMFKEAPVIAAIGTTAEAAVRGGVLQHHLLNAEVIAQKTLSFASTDDLFNDQSWNLAIVLSPYKRDISRHCDELAPAALITNVVDTVMRVNGKCVGLNTNMYSSAHAIHALVANRPPVRTLIIGTGASARSVAHGLERDFVCDIGIMGRNRDHSQEIVKEIHTAHLVEEAVHFDPDLIVNTTTVGETNDDAFDVEFRSAFHPGLRYFDLNNRTSQAQIDALAAGCIVEGGALMQFVTHALRVGLLAPSYEGS